MSMSRQFWVVCHRWAGLTIALFLAIAGFTGIFLAWITEIEGAISPQLFHVAAPYEGARPLPPEVLRSRVLARYPGGEINYMPLRRDAGKSVFFGVERVDPSTGVLVPWSDDWDQLFVDPYTGKELGRRKWGDISQGTVNLMPFVYRLHYSLALGEYGALAFGIAALIWTLDSFVGFYLTLPLRIRRVGAAPAGGPGWWRRWKPSWIVRWGSSAYKLNFDMHRAGGLWIWPMLLVFAWSSVAFNLTPVYAPVMKLFGAVDTRTELPVLDKPDYHPALDTAAAIRRGAELARTEMARRGLTAGRADAISYSPESGAYAYSFTSGRDFTEEGGRSSVAFGARDGRLLQVDLPTGQNGANTFTNWIMALHMGMVFGLPYRIAVSLIGALVTMLSVTGVVIWMKKRSGRIGRKARLPSQRARLQPAE
jgi:uncharacterized iron-regulated membrane protein